VESQCDRKDVYKEGQKRNIDCCVSGRRYPRSLPPPPPLVENETKRVANETGIIRETVTGRHNRLFVQRGYIARSSVVGEATNERERERSLDTLHRQVDPVEVHRLRAERAQDACRGDDLTMATSAPPCPSDSRGPAFNHRLAQAQSRLTEAAESATRDANEAIGNKFTSPRDISGCFNELQSIGSSALFLVSDDTLSRFVAFGQFLSQFSTLPRYFGYSGSSERITSVRNWIT